MLPSRLPRRLDKYVRDSTLKRLREVREAIADGRVQLHRPEGGVTTVGRDDWDCFVYPDDTLLLDGEVVEPREDAATFAFHKPPGVTSTLSDPRGKRDLSYWVHDWTPGAFPVGRLDRDTTGLLLITNDGDLSSAVTRPDHETQKRYWLWLNETLTVSDARLDAFRRGVELSDGLARAEDVTLERATDDYAEVAITLHEGRNRQIRRMCRAVDLRLLHLHRRSIGPIELRGLAPGGSRRLSELELEALWLAVGGRDQLRAKKVKALRGHAGQLRAAGRADPRLEKWLTEHGYSRLH